MSTKPQKATVVIDGHTYKITRVGGLEDDTVTERLDGVGLVFSERAWLGHQWSKVLKWAAAAVNPTGRPGQATAYAEGFRSRKAAWRWLLAQPEVQYLQQAGVQR